jgi:tetratricopeptide (TPR) repeat protein
MKNHIDISSSYFNIGLINSKKLNDNLRALCCFEKSFKILKEIDSEKDHPKLAAIYNTIGNSYIAQKDQEKGIFNLEKALKMRENIYRNKPHPDLAKSYKNVANCFNDESDIQKRISYQEKSIKIRAVLDEKHPELAILYNDVTTSYKKQNNIEKELIYIDKALKIHEEINKRKNHPDLVKTLLNIFSTYKSHASSFVEINRNMAKNSPRKISQRSC